MTERREHPRIPVTTEVIVRHASFGSSIARTMDVSDGGIFVLFPGCPFAVGDTVSVQVSAMEDAPLLRGIVVRIRPDGFAMVFSEEAPADQT